MRVRKFQSPSSVWREGCILNEIALGFNSLAELHFTLDNFGDCSHQSFVRLCKLVNCWLTNAHFWDIFFHNVQRLSSFLNP